MEFNFLLDVKSDKTNSHSDSSKLAYEFYFSFWKLLAEDTVDFEEFCKTYGGETIISFNTVAGIAIRITDEYLNGEVTIPKNNEPDCQAKRLAIILNSSFYTEEEYFKNKFIEFFGLCHTLANFMHFPITGNKKTSLNCQKNSFADCHDFPDKFFKHVKSFYSRKAKTVMPVWMRHETNYKYLNKFGSWKNYVEKNYLQDFFHDDDYANFIQLAPSQPLSVPFKGNKGLIDSLKKDSIQREKSKIWINDIFLKNAIAIIRQRASRLEHFYEKMGISNN